MSAGAIGRGRGRLDWVPLKVVTGGVSVLAPLVAVAFSLLLAVAFLAVSGYDPAVLFSVLAERAAQSSTWIDATQLAVPLYVSAVAVAIGFKMNLFNIGVEGQYRLSMLVAALVGAAVSLPAPLHVGVIIAAAMATGALWAGIAGMLRVSRGVNEVITTIMLNYVAIGLVAWLFDRSKVTAAGDLNAKTKVIPESGWMPDLYSEGLRKVSGFALVALLVGVVYGVVVWRTRFGFRLRASGQNASAARTSGIDSNRMILTAMLMSGAVAGLVGLPQLLGEKHAFSTDMTTMLGFNGITVALLGRNDPIGMGIAAMLIGFLNAAARYLDLEGLPKEIVTIMQGVIVLAVVVVYEVSTRLKRNAVQERHTPSTDGLAAEGAA